MSYRIELYKNRSIGERISAAIDFLKQNWKVLYKNILIGGLPLAIIMAYFLMQQSDTRIISDLSSFFLYYPFLLLFSFVNFVYLYAMTGSVLVHYEQNQLTETTGWNDLKGNFFKFAGKTALISLIVYLPIIVIVGIIAFIFGMSVILTASSLTGSFVATLVLLFLLLFFLIIAFAPFFSMLYFPSYFSGKATMESIKISFSLGFKNWGSLFVAIIITGILFFVVYMVFAAPFEMVSMFFPGEQNIVLYILAALSAIGTLLIYPILIVIFAFQYFSIVEKEEGVSLQSQVSEFENL
ncbi:MAG: hypothetical protein FWF53_03135 [Candidatus Azobacteroides sp.]|nr:hypothetical protein [Candidatus Azobacteroides sp.]